MAALLLQLYALRQPLLSRGASDALRAAAALDGLGAAATAQLLAALAGHEAAWDARDPAALLALIQALGAGYSR